jgi:pimeloyl-ACP methyl ester carboxylesterase
VFAYDQIGSGARVEEIRRFYDRYPHWSLLGKSVADTRSAIDALNSYSFIDTNRIWLLGFDAGSTIALHAAALDSRVAGVIAVGGFSNMRPALSNRGVPTFAASQRSLPLVPRLGAFVGHEDQLPYDFRELIDVIAPRPVLLYAPKIDEQVDASDLKRAFLLQTNASFSILDDYHRFGPEVQKTVLNSLKSQF